MVRGVVSRWRGVSYGVPAFSGLECATCSNGIERGTLEEPTQAKPGLEWATADPVTGSDEEKVERRRF
jgi:hypothetical protein